LTEGTFGRFERVFGEGRNDDRVIGEFHEEVIQVNLIAENK